MATQFEKFEVDTESGPPITIRGIHSSPRNPRLPALLLLHGFPQNHRVWRHVAPKLASRYNVVVMDLRGYGSSTKPMGFLPYHSTAHPPSITTRLYAKSAMAKDCVEVMKHFDFHYFFVCAHDRGAHVAHKLCVDFPFNVRRAIFLDICPTLAMYQKANLVFATNYFHWFFLIQNTPLPERSIMANTRLFAEQFLGVSPPDLGFFHRESFESYLRGLADADTVHGMCEDFRASATLDMTAAQLDLNDGRKIKCPLLVIWAKHGLLQKMYDVVREWKRVTDDGVEVTGYSVDSDHFIPEEVPEKVVEAVIAFLK